MNLYSNFPSSPMPISVIKKVFSCRPALCRECQNNNHKTHKEHYIAIQLLVTKALNMVAINEETLFRQFKPKVLACLKEHGILKTYSTKLLKDTELGRMENIIDRALPTNVDPHYDGFQAVVKVSGSKQNQTKRNRKKLPNKICQNQKFLRNTPEERFKMKKYGRKSTKLQFMDQRKYKNNYRDERLNRMVDQLDALSFEEDNMVSIEPTVYYDESVDSDCDCVGSIGILNKVNGQYRLNKLS